MSKLRALVSAWLVFSMLLVGVVGATTDASAVFGQSEPLQIGDPVVMPRAIAANTPTEVWITVEVPNPEDQLAAPEGDVLSPVELFVGRGGEHWESLGYLFDSGNLDAHADEIKGDGVYSNVFTFDEDSAGTLSLRAVVTTAEGDHHEVRDGVYPIDRLEGGDRYATAARISEAGWDSADTVLLARGDNFPDSLAGASLGYALNSPILLTSGRTLNAATKQEIERLAANKVVILGGTSAISETVRTELEAMGLTVERVSGANRFETAARIARETAEVRGNPDTALIAFAHNFPDALSAAAYGARSGYPVLLTAKNSLHADTAAVIDELGISNAIIAGGESVVGNEVKDQLAALGLSVERVHGANRYETSRLLSERFLPTTTKHLYIATGRQFPDALAGAVLAAKNNSGVVLVHGTRTEHPLLSGGVEELLEGRLIDRLTVLGGSAAVNSPTKDALQELMSGRAFNIRVVHTTGGEAVQKILDVHNVAGSILEGSLVENPFASIEELFDTLHERLLDESEVGATSSEENVFKIDYLSGLESYITLQINDYEGTRGAPSPRDSKPLISLGDQTRGVDVSPSATSQMAVSLGAIDDYEYTGSRTVLIWAPCAAEFSPHDETAGVIAKFDESQLGFQVTVLANEDADVNSLKRITDYGFVVAATHGTKGRWMQTGEIVTDPGKYEVEQQSGQVAVWQIMNASSQFKKGDPVYAVNDEWFTGNLVGRFPNTVIVNNSCESTMSDRLWNAFRAKGAGAYFGYSKVVSSRFCVEQVIDLVQKMAVEGLSTGEAYTPKVDPYSSHGATWQMRGKANLKIAQGLLNGSFEQRLSGWSTDGDGRAISRLAFLAPTHGSRMGIISTGLGFTLRHGSLSQAFQVPGDAASLTFDWNYLSEEFLEYIGSGYDDPFEVSLTTADGVQHTVMRVSVDSIAADFGATPSEGGDLIHVSPEIVFDQGDVWMTGWQYDETFDISAFRGEIVTLSFYATDAVDTIYHTAVLIDNVRVE